MTMQTLVMACALLLSTLLLVHPSEGGPLTGTASGKKKRDFNDEQRYQILRSLIERAAENNMAQ